MPPKKRSSGYEKAKGREKKLLEAAGNAAGQRLLHDCFRKCDEDSESVSIAWTTRKLHAEPNFDFHVYLQTKSDVPLNTGTIKSRDNYVTASLPNEIVTTSLVNIEDTLSSNDNEIDIHSQMDTGGNKKRILFCEFGFVKKKFTF